MPLTKLWATITILAVSIYGYSQCDNLLPASTTGHLIHHTYYCLSYAEYHKQADRTSNKYCCNFGKFDHNGDWSVKKPLIVERIMKEAEEKSLDTCPYFSLEKIQIAVQDLPEKIIVNNLHYRNFYIRDYIDSALKDKAINIRHMKPDTKPPDLISDVMKRDDRLTRTSLN